MTLSKENLALVHEVAESLVNSGLSDGIIKTWIHAMHVATKINEFDRGLYNEMTDALIDLLHELKHPLHFSSTAREVIRKRKMT
jgi:hypothetical protein